MTHPSVNPSSAGEILAGTIGRVTFHNVENGFCLLRVKARGRRDLITVVGHSASISVGEWVTAIGEWVNDRTHGPQLRAGFLRASAPTTAGDREVSGVGDDLRHRPWLADRHLIASR